MEDTRAALIPEQLTQSRTPLMTAATFLSTSQPTLLLGYSSTTLISIWFSKEEIPVKQNSRFHSRVRQGKKLFAALSHPAISSYWSTKNSTLAPTGIRKTCLLTLFVSQTANHEYHLELVSVTSAI